MTGVMGQKSSTNNRGRILCHSEEKNDLGSRSEGRKKGEFNTTTRKEAYRDSETANLAIGPRRASSAEFCKSVFI